MATSLPLCSAIVRWHTNDNASTGEPSIFFAQSDSNKWQMRAANDHFGLYDKSTIS